MTENKAYTFRLPEELLQRFRAASEANMQNQSAVLRALITEYVEQSEKRQSEGFSYVLPHR